MNYNTNGMSTDELKGVITSLRRELAIKKEDFRQETDRVKKMELDNQFLARKKIQNEEEIESKKGRLRAVENEIAHFEKSLENSRKIKETMEIGLDKSKKQSLDMEVDIKNKNAEIQRCQMELTRLEHDIKNMEAEIRER